MNTRTIVLLLVLAPMFCFSQWTDYQNGEYVIGQADFTSSGAATSSTGLNMPRAVAVDITNGKIYIADYGNHRVLRYSYPLSGNQPTAEIALGQADLNSGNANRGGSADANTLNSPTGLAVSNNVLWVSDNGNNRVLRFDNGSTKTTGANANGVLGQADFTSVAENRGGSTAANVMGYPQQISVSGTSLWVTDPTNNRILRFDNAPSKANGADADGVLGQTDMTSFSGGTSQSKLWSPRGVAIGGTTLWVADFVNNRVLRFNNATSKANGDNADGVLGQTDFTSNQSNIINTTTPAQNSLSSPTGVTVDASGRLYVADNGNFRVLLFDNAFAKADGANANTVLGQAIFTNHSQATTTHGMNAPYQSAVDNTNAKLLVADNGINRVVQYAATSALPVELTSFSVQVVRLGSVLHWKTATEINNYGFEIERRIMGETSDSWIDVGFVAGAGTSTSRHDYSYTDNNLSAGRYAYRIKQIDRDGSFKYHGNAEVEIAAPSAFSLSSNYPNPFNPSTQIEYSIPQNSQVTMKVYDVLGKEIATLVNEPKAAGTYSITWNAQNCSSGLYFYAITAGSSTITKKLVLMK